MGGAGGGGDSWGPGSLQSKPAFGSEDVSLLPESMGGVMGETSFVNQ